MKTKLMILTSIIGMVILSGCATVPTGPSVMVLPGTGKSFAEFQNDQYQCQRYAESSAGVTPGRLYAMDPEPRRPHQLR